MSNGEQKLKDIIDTLFADGYYECLELTSTCLELKYKYKILKLLCIEKKENDGIQKCQLQIKNIINYAPRNGLVQQKMLTFFANIQSYSLKEMITRYDTISKCFSELKKEEIFQEYMNIKKLRAIPFFTMMGFIAYINLGKDISDEISQLSKEKYLKDFINQYIDEKRKSLFNIIYYYKKEVLHEASEEMNSIKKGNLLLIELKDLFDRYMCFNELFDEGEIVNFVDCLYKAITSDIKSILLQEGPEISVINNVIRNIMDEILEQLSFKSYNERKNLNKLLDIIAYIIIDLSEESYEQNYAKFIIKYCRYYRQGNKNIVYAFLTGLNADNFKNTFNKLNFNNNSDSFYQNISLYIEQIGCKNKKINILQKCNATGGNNGEKNNKNNNIKPDVNHVNNSSSQIAIGNFQNKNTLTNTCELNIDNASSQNINLLKKDIELCNTNVEQPKVINEVEILKKLQNMEEKYNRVIAENKSIIALNKSITEENKSIIEDNKKFKSQNKSLKEQFNEFKEKTLNSNLKIRSELYKLKLEMRQISYRDISKPIIDSYVEKYKNSLSKEKNVKKKKDKAFKVINYLMGSELTYFKKITEKYYNSNIASHISKIFNDFGKTYVIGLSCEKNDIVDKIFKDYCKTILEEGIDDSNVINIDKLFGLKKIINDLAAEYMMS